MKINSINNLNTNTNTNFGKLKSINCLNAYGSWSKCAYKSNGEKIANELRKLACENIFFKEYDVKAFINIECYEGATLLMKCKPVAKSMSDKIKNIFKPDRIVRLHDNSRCSDDSTYFLAKQIRDLRLEENKNQLFSKLSG